MSKTDTMHIAFPFGGIIPAAVLSEKEDRKVGPHTPIRVPLAYGESLVADRFAYEAEAPKKPSKTTSAPGALETKLTDVRRAIAEATDLEAKGRLEAEAAAIEAEIAALKKP